MRADSWHKVSQQSQSLDLGNIHLLTEILQERSNSVKTCLYLSVKYARLSGRPTKTLIPATKLDQFLLLTEVHKRNWSSLIDYVELYLHKYTLESGRDCPFTCIALPPFQYLAPVMGSCQYIHAQLAGLTRDSHSRHAAARVTVCGRPKSV